MKYDLLVNTASVFISVACPSVESTATNSRLVITVRGNEGPGASGYEVTLPRLGTSQGSELVTKERMMRLAAAYPPAQSWYEEDMDELY